ncbi:adhesion G protein-coupled receptor G3 isoform X2 [Pimephales promelas]|uniref:adhesion G protein-coupled receptor G3 isoform X2 n=1 Tax=Pimephales promelas TaxID=90988 RepID=UPI00195580C1|nr:adhesion G protein-coupled receptor G3 isoform X2 [Pimephales promelas]KAG1941340.1 adhesion G-protein coupled receptor G1 [Pimephales promelas]
MRDLYCLVLWIFSNTIWTVTCPSWFCHQVPENCMKNSSLPLPLCIEQGMRQCTQPKSRLIGQSPDYFFKRIDSSKATFDTEKGYIINISDEALQRSRSKQEGDEDSVNLIVSLLNKTIFMASSSSHIEKGYKTDPVLHGRNVLGIWLGKNEVHNLSQPVQLRFRNSSENESGLCVYWHLDENGRGNWRTDGCETSIDNGDFVCSCNHLSFFAVLISPQIPEASHIIHLNYISYVGSALSIAFTALMIVMFLCQRKKKCEHSVFIHVQLSCSLFLLHISFLCSVWFSGEGDTGSVCQALGLLLHWCLLATFTWTAIEGFNLYLLLVRVFNIYIKRYMLKLSLVGWGVPTFTVMICGVTKAYGKYSFHTDKENSTATSLCWVTTPTVSYITVNGYLGLVLLFNMAMLAVVLGKMRKLRSQALQVKDQRRAWKDWVSLLGLCCVLGVPWGMAFFTHGPLSLTSLYVFTVLNGFQGIFIFIWFLTLTCQTRKEEHISSKGTIQVSFQSNEEYVTTR